MAIIGINGSPRKDRIFARGTLLMKKILMICEMSGMCAVIVSNR